MRPSKAVRYSILAWVLVSGIASSNAPARGQGSPEGHASHHPGQTEAGQTEANGAEANGAPGGEGANGGGMAGGMAGMMEQMGAPKPKELYPRLMDFPDLSMEEQAQIEEEAHQRVMAGMATLSEGLDDLSKAAVIDDFATMQAASSTMREGLAQFESGLAARRVLAEGRAPRNVALTWFKREMSLVPAATAEPGTRFFGMTLFHTGIMAVLTILVAAMIWMYFVKMRRAADLMEKLAAVEPAVVVAKEDATEYPDISQGLLQIAKRTCCKLEVARVFRETPDVKTFRLVACQGGPLPFNYLPGQFLTLTLPTGDQKIRRSYTISSSPTQGYYCEISVKREDRGAGSRYLHDDVQQGDTLEAQAPSGKFVFTGKEAESVVLIAGGVGITPMMSIARALTDMCWPGDIYFIVACRDPEHFIFASELEELRKQNANLHLHVAMSRIEKDVGGYHAGRLSQSFLAANVPDIAAKWIHLCGAPRMMGSTKEMLADLGVPAENIHFESFGSQQKPRVKAAERAEKGIVATTEMAAVVSFDTSRKSTRFLPDETVLEASERVDVNIESSCRVGMCGVCTVGLLSGRVTMEVDDGLDPDDRSAGMVLACQAKSEGDVTLEA